MNRSSVVLVVIVFLFSWRASAQMSPECTRWWTLQHGSIYVWGWQIIESGMELPVNKACCNPGNEPFGEDCRAPRPDFGAPLDAAKKTCTTCLTVPPPNNTPPTVGNPINLATGNTWIRESDISVPGLGGGLHLSRVWNSELPDEQASYQFMFGNRWRSTFEERLVFIASDSYVKYLRADGSVWSFGVTNSTPPYVYALAAPAIDTTTKITEGTGTLIVGSQSGEKHVFDSTTGMLLSIADRNGNATTLSYDSAQRLASVADPAGRHLYFNYPDGSSTLVSSVTSDVGLTLSYSYDDQGRLTRVTKPDSTYVTFEYDPQNLLTAVKDSDGKVLEAHTYDSLGRGLTSSRANGVESVTVTYPQ